MGWRGRMGRRHGAKLETQDWRQWVPDAPVPDWADLLALDEVRAWMEARETPVSGRMIQKWQTLGALPRAWSRFVDGRKEGRYPWWFFDLAAALYDFHARGMAYESAIPILRADARRLATRPSPRPKVPPTVDDFTGADPGEIGRFRNLVEPSQYKRHLYRYHLIPMLPFSYDPTTQPQQLSGFMAVILGEFVRQLADAYSAGGFEFDRATLCLLDKQGRSLIFPIVPPYAPPEIKGLSPPPAD
jgi:hypothetical protein